MNQKIIRKVIATILVITLTISNFILLGMYAGDTYATTENLEQQGSKTNDENVEFDAYFKNEEGNKIHQTSYDFNQENIKLNISVGVKQGYLKNAKVKIEGEEGTSSNFQIKNSNKTLESIERIDEKAGEIYFKQINSSTSTDVSIDVCAKKEEEYDLRNFSKINNIKITGDYVTNNGKTVKIEKTIKTRNEWTGKVEPVLEQELSKFIPYNVGEKEGTIIETKVKTGIKDNSLPIKETKIEIEVPEVKGVKPESVSVTSKGTKATNGEEGIKFNKSNWEYNEETGKITIDVTNQENNNKVTWNKEEKDEYIVTYNYEEEVEEIETKQKAKVEITAYSAQETKGEVANEIEIKAEGKVGEIVTAGIKIQNQISKGNLYTKQEEVGTYKEEIEVEISKKELTDEILINEEQDKFIDEEGNEQNTVIGDQSYITYKQTKVAKEEVDKILGEEGSIQIIGKDGEQIGIINKNSEQDEEGNYVYTYSGEVNEVRIKISKPQENGTLKIENEKNIQKEDIYSKEQIKSFKQIQAKVELEQITEKLRTTGIQSIAQMELTETTTQTEVSVTPNTLSSIVENKDVEIRVILKTNDISCDLFKNPVIEICLPSYVKGINVKNIGLLFDDALKIENYEVNGNTIKVTVKGEDLTHSKDDISKGANIVISADLTVDETTPNANEMVTVFTKDENLSTKNEEIEEIYSYAETPLSVSAPVGIITTNKIVNYNKNGEKVTSIAGIEKEGKLETKTNAQNATVNMQVINNYENKVNNIEILGRIPFEGNKNTENGQDLGSNLTTTLNSIISATGIDEEKVTVYYSTKADATKEINQDNGWVTTVEDYSTVKSYLIVLKDFDLNSKQKIEFSYELTIPENLKQNLNTYGIYTVYFDNVKEKETIKENVTATKVGLTTGQGPELNVDISANNEEIEEGKEATYNVTVTNTGKNDATNIVVKGLVEQRKIDEEESEKQTETKSETEAQTIDILKQGETKTLTLKAQATAVEEEGENLIFSAKIEADNLEKAIETSEITIPVKIGYMNLTLETEPMEKTSPRKEQEEVQYVLTIKNVNAINKEEVVVKDVLPEGVTFKESEKGTYDEQTKTVTYNLGTINAFQKEYLTLSVVTDNLQNNETKKTITNKMTVTTKDKTLETDEISFDVTKPSLEAHLSTSKEEIEVGDIITYNLKITNNGAGTATNIKVTDVIPEGLIYETSQYSLDGETYTMEIGTDETTMYIPGLESGKSVDVTIKMKADKLADKETKKEVTNKVTISSMQTQEITTNEVKTTIIPRSSSADDPSTDKIQEGTYRISGIAWLDENKDGKKDEEEKVLPEIKVTLINAENGKIVTDITTGNKKEQTTNEKGAYNFSNLEQGKYMVIFEYDTNNYALTTYKKNGVNDNVNSDVTLVTANINGENKKVGTTDKLSIENQNLDNIDIGLIESAKFDLKLDKVITKITKQTSGKNTEYTYKDTKFAKLDIKDKEVNSTNIVVEYKIRITNEGDVAGYAKKIVDYIPEGMMFTSNLNPDWYQSTNGSLYNASLANEIILPTETKELTLYLTKTMNNNNLGLINNNAEISESYSEAGLSDVDSTAGNKVQSEDDISNADAMISVKTGEVYIYITITTLCFGLLALGIYIIRWILRRV